MSRSDRTRPRGPALALLAPAFSALMASCAPTPPDVPGLFILGVDGMDPVISQRLMDEGKLPNLARLAKAGGFQNLATINPPQSPVAWSSFVTGLDPGGHGIFDFVHRDPLTYMPISSATPPPGPPGTAIEIGDMYFPLSGATGPARWGPLAGACSLVISGPSRGLQGG